MINFVVRIADVYISIAANFEDTKKFFENFLSNELAEEFIEVSDVDIKGFKRKYPSFSEFQCEKAVIKYRMDLVLVNYNTFPIHSSAIAYNGRAFLFTALSGVGKSTHSQRWCEAFGDEVVIINDDRPYIRIHNDRVYAYSHPQAGKHGRYTNSHYPVCVIGKIVRDDKNYVKPIPKYEAFPLLVQQSFTLDIPSETGKVIKIIQKVVNLVDFFEIHCNLDEDAGKIICEKLFELITCKNNKDYARLSDSSNLGAF